MYSSGLHMPDTNGSGFWLGGVLSYYLIEYSCLYNCLYTVCRCSMCGRSTRAYKYTYMHTVEYKYTYMHTRTCTYRYNGRADDAVETFQTLKSNCIGLHSAHLYAEWALLELALGRCAWRGWCMYGGVGVCGGVGKDKMQQCMCIHVGVGMCKYHTQSHTYTPIGNTSKAASVLNKGIKHNAEPQGCVSL